MSSATSISPDSQGTAAAADASLRPWQLFLLLGMLSATAVVIVATGQSAASIIILSITVVAASIVAIGAYSTLAPLVLPEDARIKLIEGRTRIALEREKALVLRSIKELEFDFAMKKVARSDYDEVGARLRARAIGLIRQLDADLSYRDAIERELTERLQKSGITVSMAADDVAVAADVTSREETIQVCESCGASNDTDARFCKSCGSRLAS